MILYLFILRTVNKGREDCIFYKIKIVHKKFNLLVHGIERYIIRIQTINAFVVKRNRAKSLDFT